MHSKINLFISFQSLPVNYLVPPWTSAYQFSSLLFIKIGMGGSRFVIRITQRT
jgi:hypothetical protein